MTSLIKIFRFKKPKEVNNDHREQIKRNEESRFSLRSSPVPTWRSSKDAIYIGGTSWNRPAAPYSIVTAPKKGRSTRSCPGGVTAANVPTNVKCMAPMQSVQHLQSHNGNAIYGTAAAHDTKHLENAVKTSEYGSCEPSPTNNVSHALCTTLPDSDCDNDYLNQLQRCEFELRKVKRRLKEERHRFKEQIVAVQNECDYMKRIAEKTTRALVVAQRNIESERHKNQALRRRLRESDALISELQCQLRHERMSREERNNCCMALGQSSLGAGEALCALSLSQSNANLFDAPPYSISTQPFNNDLPDEVRNFRTTGCCDSPSIAAETPPSSTPSAYERSAADSTRRTTVDEVNMLKNCTQARSVLRRSFSDSELPVLIASVESNNNNIIQRSSSPLLIRTSLNPRQLLAHNNSELNKGASFSSDEEFATLELIGKQLRRRGDVVRFIPPRRTVRQSTFRQFGRRERIALAEFDYLHELSTDASAIASSPDCARFDERLQ